MRRQATEAVIGMEFVEDEAHVAQGGVIGLHGSSLRLRIWAPAVAGVTIGLVAAYWLSGVLKTSLKDLLFGIEARDTANLAMIALLTLLVASVACLIPARRATKVDPITALRSD